MERREFIRKLGRGMIAAGMVAGGTCLLLKPDTGQACNLDFICKKCKQNTDCSLPEAKDYR